MPMSWCSPTSRPACHRDFFSASRQSLTCVLHAKDLPDAMDCSSIADALGLHKMRGRSWQIQASNAIDGTGLYEGLDWLSNSIHGVKQ